MTKQDVRRETLDEWEDRRKALLESTAAAKRALRDARLIAAAPDLLAAAEALLGHRFYRASGLSDSHAELLGALRAAIAAAKGEE